MKHESPNWFYYGMQRFVFHTFVTATFDLQATFTELGANIQSFEILTFKKLPTLLKQMAVPD